MLTRLSPVLFEDLLDHPKTVLVVADHSLMDARPGAVAPEDLEERVGSGTVR